MLEQGSLRQEAETGRWNVVIGAGPAVGPNYPGARDDRVRLVPFASASYSGETHFFVGPFGLGFSPVNVGGFHAGPIIGLTPNRRPSDDPHLNGLGDISTSATAGVFALYGVADVTWLTGDTADSPIVERSTQEVTGVGLAYRF